MRICGADCCGHEISVKNVSGVCGKHLHSKWCVCRQCEMRAVSPTEMDVVGLFPQFEGLEDLPIEDVPLDQIDPLACLRFWSVVLNVHWDDALQGVSAKSRNWMGGRDFRRTCELIGLDDGAVMAKYRDALADVGVAA